MQHELKSFLRRIFKEDTESILRYHLNSIGLSNVDAATPQQRKQLAESIKSAFPYASIAKTSVLYAELLKILSLQVTDLEKSKITISDDRIYYDEDGNEISGEELFFSKDDKKFFTTKEEYIKFRMEIQNKVVNQFWSKIDKSLTKFEVIFNLFWLKAGEAELRGINHNEVMKITNKSLIGIKKDLEEAFKELKDKFGIREIIEKQQRLQFHLKNAPELKDKSMEKERNKRYFGEEEILNEIKFFWEKIENQYNEFNRLFMFSLNKEIELKKKKEEDERLIKFTENNMIQIWNKIEEEYENLKSKIENIQKNAKEKLENDEK
jgi:hypothetical protein